jgi:hypothetical protein
MVIPQFLMVPVPAPVRAEKGSIISIREITQSTILIEGGSDVCG